ncbi:hypothetical protein FSP39_003275 [Pinctada imbricata]|uniref:MHD2 domain-containing protein n=1 Tax=Pinctada imbricata TaxID=66713 RepID=A0AA88XXW7_PINIB|nr:hypothetical protein FSP39_003275 [Pinctada imbricata]
MSVVPAETLFDLIRRSFRLNQTTFSQYEASIYTQYGKKEPGRILAEELVGQLAALENNSNPFYNSSTYMTPQGFDRWQRYEFSHIGELMTKFWHTAYPQQPSNFLKTLQCVHEDYAALLHKLIRYELPYRKDAEMSVPGPTSLLASASVRLLREFGLRYGIGEVYRKLVYLHYLTTHFEVTVWFIQHTCSVLASFIDMLPKSGIKYVMVKREGALYVDCLKGLESRAASIFLRMKSIFPENRPPDGLESVIELIRLTQEGRQLLDDGSQQTVKNFLLAEIQGIFPKCYNEHKMVVMRDLKQNNQQLTPTLLNMMIGKLRDEVKDYKINYQSTFEGYCDITTMAAKSLYNSLMDDVIRVFQIQQDQAPRPQKIDKQLLGLGYRLNQLDLVWRQYIPVGCQVWREWFQKEQIHWSVVIKTDIQGFIMMSISQDKFDTDESYEIPSALTSQSSTSVSSNPRYRSRSIKSLTPSINSAFSGLLSSSQSTPIRQDSASGHQSQPHSYPTIPEQNGGHEKSSSAGINVPKLSHLPQHHMVDRFKKGSDTQSLLEFEDDSMVSFAGIRPSSSLPDILSKSYDHHLDTSRRVNSNQNQAFVDKDPEIIHANGNEILNEESRTKDTGINITLRAEDESKNPHTTSMNSEENVKGMAELDEASGSESGDSDYMDTVNDFPQVPKTTVDEHIPGDDSRKETGPHEEILQRNGRIMSSSDRDSLAEEFQNSCDSIQETSNVCQSESESESDNSESNTNFKFPQVSQVEEVTSPMFVPLEIPQDVRCGPSTSASKIEDGGTETQLSTDKTGDDGKITLVDTNPIMLEVSPTSSPLNGHIQVTVPISGSVIDLVVVLQRLVGFGSTLCHTFYRNRQPNHADFETSFSSTDSGDEIMTFHNGDMRRKLYEHFLESVCAACTIYADNVLCMDICGTTLSMAKKLVGPKMVEYLETQRRSDLIWGCRHDVKGVKNCFEFVNKRTSLLCDRYEQVTEDMCTRINNVSLLLWILDTYHTKLQHAFDIHDDWQLQGSTDRTAQTYRDFEVIDQFQYNPDSDQGAVVETGSQRVDPGGVRPRSTRDVYVQCPTKSCHSHLMAVLRALSRTMAYRINLFVGDALSILLALRDPSVPVSVCLSPLTQFLTTYLELLQRWLYHDNYRRVTECLWIFIIQDFEEEVNKLWTRENSEEYSIVLIQSLIEETMFKLQIFSTPTTKLIDLYDKLCEHVYGSDTSSTCTMDSSLFHLLHKMKEDLLLYRKCFSGKQLVSWIMHNADIFIPILDPSLTSEDVRKDRGLSTEIAQWLQDKELIIDITEEDSGESEVDSVTEYPLMTITHATVHQNPEDLTPTATPRATPLSHGIKTHSLYDPHKKMPIREHAFFQSMRLNSRNSRTWTPIQLGKAKRQLDSATSSLVNQRVERSVSSRRDGSDDKMSDNHSSASSDTIECENGHYMADPIATPAFDDYSDHFMDTRNHFYILTSLEESSIHNHQKKKLAWDSHELKLLVERAFQNKISPDFILRILYNRRKYDAQAKNFFLTQPQKASVFRKMSEKESCEVS